MNRLETLVGFPSVWDGKKSHKWMSYSTSNLLVI
jgi:hypothetical protein